LEEGEFEITITATTKEGGTKSTVVTKLVSEE
jgi:hypothetical protein